MAKKRIYGTGDKLDNVPFNVDNLPRNKYDRAIFRHFGYESWRDIFISEDDITAQNLGGLRATVYNTPHELLREYGKERGILQYVKILYYPQTDTYHAFINY